MPLLPATASPRQPPACRINHSAKRPVIARRGSRSGQPERGTKQNRLGFLFGYSRYKLSTGASGVGERYSAKQPVIARRGSRPDPVYARRGSRLFAEAAEGGAQQGLHGG